MSAEICSSICAMWVNKLPKDPFHTVIILKLNLLNLVLLIKSKQHLSIEVEFSICYGELIHQSWFKIL